MNQKSQAALEFIMTYGLALIAVLAVLAAISYLDVMNPDRLLPEKCEMDTASLQCTDFASNKTHLIVHVQNDIGRSLHDYTLNAVFIKDGFGKTKSLYDLNYSYFSVVRNVSISKKGSGKVFVNQLPGPITSAVAANQPSIEYMICVPQRVTLAPKQIGTFLCGGTDFCKPNPCQNDALCSNTLDGYTCLPCPIGFDGKNCDIPVDVEENEENESSEEPPCYVDPLNNTYYCRNPFTPCYPSPCLNGGICSYANTGITCTCLDGFTGITCENNIDDCALNPCVHGNCTDGPNSYICTCDEGFDGINCSHEIFMWEGFEGGLLDTINAGSALPIRFGLRGNQGLDIIDPTYPQSGKIDCNLSSEVTDIKTTNTPGNSLSYHEGTDRYTYVWKTEKSYKGTCRQFMLKLTDGTIHYKYFRFS